MSQKLRFKWKLKNGLEVPAQAELAEGSEMLECQVLLSPHEPDLMEKAYAARLEREAITDFAWTLFEEMAAGRRTA